MRQEVFRGYESVESMDKINKIVSFKPFIDYLDNVIDKNGVSKKILAHAKERIIELLPENLEIHEVDLGKYAAVYEIVYQLLNPPMMEEKENYWGLSVPFSPTIFYSSDSLYALMNTKLDPLEDGVEHEGDKIDKNTIKTIIIYNLVLKKLYNIEMSEKDILKYSFRPNLEEDRIVYLGIDYNSDFLEVSYDGELPELNVAQYSCKLSNIKDVLSQLLEALPLEKITIKGISILNLRDITTTYLKDKVRGFLISNKVKKTPHRVFADIFKGLLGNSKLDIILSPLLIINKSIVQDLWEGLDDDFRTILGKYNMEKDVFFEIIKDYTDHPNTIFHKNLKNICSSEKNKIINSLDSSIKSVLIRPVFTNKTKMVGAIAIFSDQENMINEDVLARLEDVVPLLEQLFEGGINSYSGQLTEVLKNKFTSIQPSVEWKFTDAAIQYLHDKRLERHPAMKSIHFENVYPIYGAVDIRDSTIERNNANAADYRVQLQAAILLLEKINLKVPISIIGELIFKAKKWIQFIEEGISSDKEPELIKFLDKEIGIFVTQFGSSSEELSQMTASYFEDQKAGGRFHNNVLDIEKTFKILNSSIASLLDQMNDKVQETYPCFFERYRSDGLEYNFYIGQSITPERVYSDIYLKNLQLWQVNTMAIIAKITEELQPQLPHPLRTTQLIFIHSNTIDISFRNDEHRFDVEGTYNIRYEIVKKRIDKAIVKHTQERLTQPGKVAIVYFFKKDVEEYISHIKYLQDKDIFEDDLEDIELDDLQGVTGLRAIRVSIKKDDSLKLLNASEHLAENIAVAQEAVARLN
ncbi:hypothetical protein [Rhizosphaericola mali]|uniref:GAF domain-containing protein n=1 Tax=Rhizosphaericola mali TaxID=2545455 RepID=A0A5P2FUX8_9BACT|nr:hypothetical protein [Rhizosphaericola mali]QES87276.1 hypothetical protein E0W69_000895 [Rhizosphaericola mali]